MIKKLRWRIVWITMLLVIVFLIIILYINYASTSRSLQQQSIMYLDNILSDELKTWRPRQKGESADLQSPFFTVIVNQFGQFVIEENDYFDFEDDSTVEDIVTKSYYSENTSGVLENYNLRYKMTMMPMGVRIAFVDTSVEQNALKTILLNSVYIGVGVIIVCFALMLIISKKLVMPIEKSLERQRRFVSDASHELKTPLSVIMANAELLSSEEQSERNSIRVENIQQESSRMRHLIEGMLEQARADESKSKNSFETLDLGEIITEAAMAFEPIAYDNGKSLSYNIEEGISVSGDCGQLRQLATILLDNAVKYSFPSTTIELTLQTVKKCPVLTVTDEGEKIPPEFTGKIFDRFFRADEARNDGASYGLGLSIAKEIADAHDAEISAESTGESTSFTVTFPKR